MRHIKPLTASVCHHDQGGSVTFERCLRTVFAFKNISTLNPKFYIYFLSSGQANKQAGPHLACLLAQIGPFSLLACLLPARFLSAALAELVRAFQTGPMQHSRARPESTATLKLYGKHMCNLWSENTHAIYDLWSIRLGMS